MDVWVAQRRKLNIRDKWLTAYVHCVGDFYSCGHPKLPLFTRKPGWDFIPTILLVDALKFSNRLTEDNRNILLSDSPILLLKRQKRLYRNTINTYAKPVGLLHLMVYRSSNPPQIHTTFVISEITPSLQLNKVISPVRRTVHSVWLQVHLAEYKVWPQLREQPPIYMTHCMTRIPWPTSCVNNLTFNESHTSVLGNTHWIWATWGKGSS